MATWYICCHVAVTFMYSKLYDLYSYSMYSDMQTKTLLVNGFAFSNCLITSQQLNLRRALNSRHRALSKHLGEDRDESCYLK